jgi:hypothetical protein
VDSIHVNVLLKRLGLPHLYRHLVISSRRTLHRLSDRLVNDSSIGLHIRSLSFRPQFFHISDLFMRHLTDSGISHSEAMMDILSRAPRLTRVYSEGIDDNLSYPMGFSSQSMLDWDSFCVLAETAGSSLLEFEGLCISNTESISAPYPFASFTALRVLVWNCTAVFDVSDGISLRESLLQLEYLTIRACHPSFLELLVDME